MRKLIDNYITASDSVKIGEFDDLTLLDFVAEQGEIMTEEDAPQIKKKEQLKQLKIIFVVKW